MSIKIMQQMGFKKEHYKD